MQLAALLLVAVASNTLASTITLGTTKFFPNGCSGEPDEMPFMAADTCEDFGSFDSSGNIYMKFDCTAQQFQMHDTATCNGTSIFTQSFACETFDIPANPEFGLPASSFGLGYGCKEYDADKVLKLVVSSAPCGSDGTIDTDNLQYTAYQVVNTCLEFPKFGGSATAQSVEPTYQVLTQGTNTLKFQYFGQSNTCSGAADFEFSVNFESCSDASSTELALFGRRLRELGATEKALQPHDAFIRALQGGGSMEYLPAKEGTAITGVAGGSGSAAAGLQVANAAFVGILALIAVVMM